MTLETARSFFLYCTVIDSGILLLWFWGFFLARDWMYRLHGRWFHFSKEQFDAIHYGGMALFKFGIILFNAVPWIALSILN